MKSIWLVLLVITTCHSSFGKQSDDYDENPGDGDIAPSSYVLPEEIFNDGKAFYVEKDPVSGKLDFNLKKSSDIVDIADEDDAQKDKDISLNTNSIPVPNFHDFLNLPVKYSSSKFVYPLVSSSYANLKYQGNNKNYISNHKNYSTSTTTSPKYYTSPQISILNHDATTTTLRPMPPLPSTTTTTTTTTLTPTIQTSTVQVSPSTSKPVFTRTPAKYSTTKYKYSTIRKRPIPTNSTMDINLRNPEMTSTTPVPLTTTVPPSPTTITPSTATVTSSTPTTVTTTTLRPTTISYSTLVTLDRQTTPPFAFKPLPASETIYFTKEPNNIFHEMSNGKDPDTMSLSDLFNSLLEDNQVNSNEDTSASEIKFELETKKPAMSSNSTTLVNGDDNKNDYVSFNVQQPNINRVQFHSMPNMNNVVISPEQNSATFVLGSQQSVGDNGQFIGSVEKDQSYHTQNKEQPPHQYQYGNVFNDMSVPAMKPQGFTAPNQKPIIPSLQPFRQDSDKFNSVNSNIRFPTDNFDDAPIVTGTFNNDIAPPNGHGGPIALPQTGNGLVVFPPNTQSIEATVNAQHQAMNNDYLDTTNTVSFNVGSNINFNGEQAPNGPNANTIIKNGDQESFNNPIQLQQTGINPFQQAQKESLQPPQQPESIYPPLSASLMPPSDSPMRRPPFMDHHRQGPARPTTFPQNEFTKKPFSGSNRPVNDRTLPNILPQFRPNAKLAQGQGHAYNKEQGNNGRPNQQQGYGQRQPTLHQRIQHAGSMTRHPPPHYRRNPQMPNNFKIAPAGSMSSGPLPPSEQADVNRRYFKIRPPVNDRMYGPPPNRRYFDTFTAQRNSDLLDYKPDSYLPIYPKQDQDHAAPKREAELQQDIIEQRGKLEPVVTLQMLQQKKLFQKDFAKTNMQQQDYQQEPQPNDDTPVAVASSSNTPPVYVVYPVKTSPMKLDIISSKDTDDPVVVGHRGEQGPMPPNDINQMAPNNDYQNTPFTVVRQEQTPILMAKQKGQTNKPPFPYALEKPIPGLNGLAYGKIDTKDLYDQRGALYNTGEEPADSMGRVVNKGSQKMTADDEDDTISTKLIRLTERPIAIAYTPTERNHYYGNLHTNADKFSNPNHASSVIQEILDDDGDIDEFGNPSRGGVYEQDFQAPFYPSMNLGGNIPTEKRNGWAVVTPNALVSATDDSSIDRSDSEDMSVEKLEHTSTPSASGEEGDGNTERFSMDRFQPDFQSGFMPIYPNDPKSTQKSPKVPKDDKSIEALVYEDMDKEENTTSS